MEIICGEKYLKYLVSIIKFMKKIDSITISKIIEEKDYIEIRTNNEPIIYSHKDYDSINKVVQRMLSFGDLNEEDIYIASDNSSPVVYIKDRYIIYNGGVANLKHLK